MSSQPGDALDLAARIRMMYVQKGICINSSRWKSISQDTPYMVNIGLDRGLRQSDGSTGCASSIENRREMSFFNYSPSLTD